MSDFVGSVAVPSLSPSVTFPLVTRWPYGIAQKPRVVTHQFGSANAKIEQRFLCGFGAALVRLWRGLLLFCFNPAPQFLVRNAHRLMHRALETRPRLLAFDVFRFSLHAFIVAEAPKLRAQVGRSLCMPNLAVQGVSPCTGFLRDAEQRVQW